MRAPWSFRHGTMAPGARCWRECARQAAVSCTLQGKPIEEALQLTNKAVVEALDGLPPAKIHCSVLAEEAVKAAVADYYNKNGIAYDDKEFKCDGCCHSCELENEHK